MTATVHYLRRNQTPQERQLIALAKLKEIHATTGALIALHEARQILREMAEIKGGDSDV